MIQTFYFSVPSTVQILFYLSASEIQYFNDFGLGKECNSMILLKSELQQRFHVLIVTDGIWSHLSKILSL